MAKTMVYLKEEVIFQHSLHRHHQQIPQGELSVICSLWTLLQDESTFFQTHTRIFIWACARAPALPQTYTWGRTPPTQKTATGPGPGPAAGPGKVQLPAHLQLHADVLSVLAELIQGADGRLHVTAVFPIDQQPETTTVAQISRCSKHLVAGWGSTSL